MSVTFAVSEVVIETTAPRLRALDRPRDAVQLRGPAELVDGPRINPLVHAIHLAYAEHRALELAPDDVWLCVLQGVAAHVSHHAEALREALVRHEGQLEIEIRRDDLAPAADPPGDWSTVPGELCDEVLRRSTDRARGLVQTFSTTDDLARVAMNVALLDAMSSYFRYSVGTLCGIPRITLLGTPDDWRRLERAVDALEGLGLDAWLPSLRVVLGKLARAAEGDADAAFFQAIYKPFGMSGGDLVSGWIHVLFPYFSDDPRIRDVAQFLGDDPRDLVKPDRFPLGCSRVRFTWKLFGHDVPMEMTAGHVGVAWNEKTLAVRPRMGHWIAPAEEERRFLVTNPGRAPFISPKDGKTLSDLSTLARETRDHEHAKLHLWWCPNIRSLEGIEGARTLDSVSIMECNELDTLAPIAGLPLTELSVGQCSGLTDVSAIRTLHRLENLSLSRCPGVRELPPIEDLEHLSVVSLWGFELPERFKKQLADREEIAALRAWIRAARG